MAFLAAAAGIGWFVGTESGLHWAAAKVPGLETAGLRGRLAGTVFAEKLAYQSPALGVTAENVALRAHLAALLGGRLTIDPLRAATISVALPERQEGTQEAKLELPVRLHIADVQVDSIELRRGDARYLVEEVRLDHARLGPDVSAAGSLYWPDERLATRARIELRGSLERIEVHAAGDVAGIAAEARATLTPQSPQKVRAIDARAGPIDLAHLGFAPRTALNAALKGDMTAGGALAGTIALDNSLAGPLDAQRLPFTRLEARFLADFGSARLEGVRAALAGGGAVQGEAELSAGRAQAKLVAAAVDLRAIHSRLRRTALHGPLEVLVEGERQWARGSLTQEGIGLTAEVVRQGETLEVRELRALADGGEVGGTGKIRIDQSLAFDARLVVTRFNPAALGDYPVGSLSGSIDASGRLAPRDVDLKWALADSTLHGRTFQSDGRARIVGERVTQADAEIRLGANRLSARGAYGRPGDELAFALDAPRLEELSPVAGGLRARGTLSGSLADPRLVLSAEADTLTLPGAVQVQRIVAKLNGSLASHEIDLAAEAPALALAVDGRLRGGWHGERGWIGELVSLRNSGAYPLAVTAPASLKLAPERVELGRLEARLAEGRVLVREASWSPSRLASNGEFTRLPAQWGIVAAGLAERLSATLVVDGEWQLVRAREIEGFVRMRRAEGDVALVGADSIDLGLERASFEVRFAEGGAHGRLEAASRLALVELHGVLMPELDVQGKVRFAELGTLTGPLLEQARLDGRLSAELRASGSLASPRIHGALAGEALVFELPLYGVSLREGSLQAVLEGETLKLESFAARGGEGRFSASGTLPLTAAGEARIAWKAERLAVLDRPDMRLAVSGAGEARYEGEHVSLSGDLRADRGRFELARDRLPKLGDDVVVAGQRPRVAKTKPILPIALDLRLDLGDNLVVQGYGFDGKVAGLIDLATTKEGELRAYGRLQAVNATFLAYGQRLDVDPGVLIFDGPIDNPSLQITAWRRKQAVEAGVQVTGTARAPAVNLVSQPPVPEGERLSWLVLGRPPSGATQADLGLLQAAAGALLAGGDSVPLDRRIARRFGLDELALRGSGEFTDNVVAVGKRLSQRLYISYEQGIGAVATSLLRLDYALGRRWTLRAETGSSSGGGLFYRYSWD